MCPIEVNVSNGQIMGDLEEIGKLNYNEERRSELEPQIEDSADRIEISDESAEKQLWEQKKELGPHKETLAKRIEKSRKRIQECDQKDYIIGLSQPPEVIEAPNGDLQNVTKRLGTQKMRSTWEMECEEKIKKSTWVRDFL